MAVEFNPGGASDLDEAVRIRFLNNPDTNNFSDALLSKLNGITAGANLYVHPNHTGHVTSSGDGSTTIANGVVTLVMMAALTAQSVIMRGSASGTPTAATFAANEVLRRDGSGNLAPGLLVTGNYGDGTVTFAKLANIAQDTVYGRISAGSGVAKALTKSELTTLINPFTSVLPGAVPASGGGTDKFLRADGTFAVPPGSSVGALVAGPGIDIDNTDPEEVVISVAAGETIDQKTTPVNADKAVIFDSVDSDATKVVTIESIRDSHVVSKTAGITGADAVTNIVSLTTAEYGAIVSPNASTLYIITDAA